MEKYRFVLHSLAKSYISNYTVHLHDVHTIWQQNLTTLLGAIYLSLFCCLSQRSNFLYSLPRFFFTGYFPSFIFSPPLLIIFTQNHLLSFCQRALVNSPPLDVFSTCARFKHPCTIGQAARITRKATVLRANITSDVP